MAEGHRRQLFCETLDEVGAEAKRLLEQGYQPVGKWNLAQVCGHCNTWMKYPIDGFPKFNVFVRGVFWMMKVSFGKRAFKKMLESKQMPAGNPTLKNTIPNPDFESDEKAVHELCETIERFKAHDGPWHPSPLFGDLSAEECEQLQLIHCSHHLSFLVPKDD